jgi:sulfoxide reductase catalytic subunit YedY
MRSQVKSPPIKSYEITDESVYLQRRRLIQAAVGSGVLAAAGMLLPGTAKAQAAEHFRELKKGAYSAGPKPTPRNLVTTYNNFYEFGTDKKSPALKAGSLRTRPWSVEVSGECAKPGPYDIEDILTNHTMEERIYRFRCVEAWSMVVPWVGFPLGDLLRRFEPTSRAKYVKFTTLYDPEQMPGQRRSVLNWPYVEGLRIDEAMHPLTILAVGMYGEIMPNQNGAPIRLIVPWKYGFKSIKSIVRIEFTSNQPVSSWTQAAASEYGFYSNVNPLVDHPRWSQKKERRLGDSIFASKHETLMFNGYADQVANLYSGMDLRKYY